MSPAELPSKYWDEGPQRHGLQKPPELTGGAEIKTDVLLVGPDGKAPILKRVTAPNPIGFRRPEETA